MSSVSTLVLLGLSISGWRLQARVRACRFTPAQFESMLYAGASSVAHLKFHTMMLCLFFSIRNIPTAARLKNKPSTYVRFNPPPLLCRISAPTNMHPPIVYPKPIDFPTERESSLCPYLTGKIESVNLCTLADIAYAILLYRLSTDHCMAPSLPSVVSEVFPLLST